MTQHPEGKAMKLQQGEVQRFDLAEKRLALEALGTTVIWHPDKPLEIRGSFQ